jgi:hypothetical protein
VSNLTVVSDFDYSLTPTGINPKSLYAYFSAIDLAKSHKLLEIQSALAPVLSRRRPTWVLQFSS